MDVPSTGLTKGCSNPRHHRCHSQPDQQAEVEADHWNKPEATGTDYPSVTF